jgi:hypothetical protein
VSINPTIQPVVTTLAAAIQKQEGYAPGTVAYRNNNPGNLWDGNNAIWPNLPHDANGFVIFPSYADGQAALENDLSIKINRGMDLTGLITMYAPPSQNNTAAYIANVSTWTGLPTDVPLNQVDLSAGNVALVADPTLAVDPTTGLIDPSQSDLAGTMSQDSMYVAAAIGIMGLIIWAVWS